MLTGIQSILIVERVPAIADMLSMAAELAGYHVMLFTWSAEAAHWLKDAQTSNCLPALVLLDISLAGLEDHTFLQQLRDRPKTVHPAVIAMTTGNDTSDQLGVPVFRKPFNIRELMDMVERLILERSALKGNETVLTHEPTSL